jgi:FkbM family methyltransferase
LKIFLDIGAHKGQSLRLSSDSRYRFDRIVCFEPAATCWAELARIDDWRVTIERFGLWKKTCQRPLYGPGSLGASIFSNKPNVEGEPEIAAFVRATDWFRANVPWGAEVYMKLNCEGSECDILGDLLDSGEIGKVKSMLIHFDIRKIPGGIQKERQIRERLEDEGAPYVSADEVVRGPTVAGGVHAWLASAGADEIAMLGPVDRIRSESRRLWFVEIPARAGRIGRRLLPKMLHGSLQPVWDRLWQRH